VKSWLEISEARLAANYALLRAVAGAETPVLAVVKANGYGHGAVVCSGVLARAGAEWLGVTDAAEGDCVLRALGGDAEMKGRGQPKILVMSGMLAEDADVIVRRGLVPVVWTREQMEWLLGAAARRGDAVRVPVHLEIDTGMSRQGVTPGLELDGLLEWLKGRPELRLDGVMTHFASAEVAGSAQTRGQRESFERAIGAVERAGLRPDWVHAGNSSVVDTEPGEGNLAWLRAVALRAGARPMVRAGLALYGYCLPVCPPGEAADAFAPAVRGGLRPVLGWKTRILSLREVPAGAAIGYNGTFVAADAMRIALLPVGYADGLRRELSGSNSVPGGWAMVQGRRAPIVGRVSMNLTTIDVSGIAGVEAGDEVTLLGDGITADDHAGIAGTIAYEIVCGLRAPGCAVRR